MLAILVSCIIYSCLLSLICMGFTLQYTVMGVPNLAHTTITFSATYASFTVTLLGLSPYLGVPIACAYCGATSFLLYRFLAFLRNRGISLVGLMISTLVFDLIIYAIMNIYTELASRIFQVFAYMFALAEKDFAFMGLPGIFFVSVIAAFSLITAIHLILTKTKFGIAMRAVMENYSLSRIYGVDVDKVLSISWLLVGGIAGIAGSLYPIWFGMDPMVSTRILTAVFAGAIVGGLRSIYGALLGGFIIGTTEILGTYGLSFVLGPGMWAYRSALPILVVSIALLVMPNGLAGLIWDFRLRRKK